MHSIVILSLLGFAIIHSHVSRLPRRASAFLSDAETAHYKATASLPILAAFPRPTKPLHSYLSFPQ